jgi:hypothetical protein
MVVMMSIGCQGVVLFIIKQSVIIFHVLILNTITLNGIMLSGISPILSPRFVFLPAFSYDKALFTLAKLAAQKCPQKRKCLYSPLLPSVM